MKKIFSILLIAACTMAFTSCGDDTTNPYAVTSTLAIDYQTVLFDAVGGEGTVEVQAPNGITKVESAKDWCTVNYSGTTITVTVTQNDKLDGRASLLTIWSGEESITVTVQQQGIVFDVETESLLVLDDAAYTREYPTTSTLPIQVTTSADWITGSYTDGKLTLNVAENTSGTIRSGEFTYKAGNIEETIQIKQGALADIVGKEYYIGGFVYDSSTGQHVINALPAQLTTSEDGTCLLTSTMPNLPWTLPVTFNAEDLSLTIHAGEYMGRYQRYFMFSGILSMASGYTWNTGATMTAVLDNADGEGISGDFMNDGVTEDKQDFYITFDLFNRQAATAQNWIQQSVVGFYQPFIQEK